MNGTPAQRATAIPGLYLLVAVLLAGLRFWPVQFSQAADADQFLTHAAAIAPFERASAWTAFVEIAAYYHSAAPGWFPLGPLQLAPWLSGISIPAAKFLQYVSLVAAFGLFAFVARKLTRSDAVAVVAVVVALCAWQFRTVHDPAIGTSFLIAWTVLTVLGAYAGWLAYLDSGRPPALASCYVASALAVLNGPIAWILVAVLGVVALRSLRRRAAFGICAIAVAGAVASIASGPLPWPWQHGGTYAGNVVLQFLAALPASFRAFGNLPVARVADLYYGTRYVDDRFILIPAITAAGWAFAIACAAAAYVASGAGRAGTDGAARLRRSEASIFGACFWLVPALALGAGGEWQHGLPPGEAFQGVAFEYFGAALLATVALQRLFASNHLAARLVPSLVALAAFTLAYGNARSDAYVLAETARLDGPNAAIARAGKAGFFDQLPDGAAIAPSPSLPFAGWGGSGIADPKYALFQYTGRRFDTEPYAALRGRGLAQPWILDAPNDPDLLVTLAHWAGADAGEPLVDRAFGYAVRRGVAEAAAGPRRGVVRAVVALRDGSSIDARRVCGSVAPALAFAPSRPTLIWGSGFVRSGPIGYDTSPSAPPQTLLGTYLTFFPKVYLADRGTATIVPSACPPGTIVFKAVAVALRPSRLIVRTPAGERRFAIDNAASTILVRIPIASRAPLTLHFSTDAPAADWENIYFRYERDVPFKRRVVVQPADVSESR